MNLRALFGFAVAVALMLPAAATGQSLFAELGLDLTGQSATPPAEPEAVMEGNEAVMEGNTVAQASRRNGAWNQPMLNVPVSQELEVEEGGEGDAASAPRNPERDRQVTASFGLFSGFGTVPYQYQRQTVRYETDHGPGTIVIDTGSKFLYHVGPNGMATRYGVGVGRQGFEWKGIANIGAKREWPDWYPPPEMREREPWLPVRMEGGPENPLGARALYLYKGGADTLYRIHGTNQPETIGQAVSSGCIRMLNDDVIHLFGNVEMGTKVVVI